MHGHRGIITLSLIGDIQRDENSAENGMVKDFSNIKAKAQPIIDMLDHNVILQYNEDDDLIKVLRKRNPDLIIMSTPPTAEALCHFCMDAFRRIFGSSVYSVSFEETASNVATMLNPIYETPRVSI